MCLGFRLGKYFRSRSCRKLLDLYEDCRLRVSSFSMDYEPSHSFRSLILDFMHRLMGALPKEANISSERDTEF